MSLRQRIILTLLPLLVLPALVGGAAVWLLSQIERRVDAILRENYDTVVYMQRLKEALDRIDTTYLRDTVHEPTSATQHEADWTAYRHWLAMEQGNITEPGESELVQELTELTRVYHEKGEAFHRNQVGRAQRDYFGSGGLLELSGKLNDCASRISALNQESMIKAAATARATARRSVVGLAFGLGAAVLLALLFGWQTLRSILRPIQAVTESAVLIGLGNLDQVVPVLSGDELGRLAESFNTMARQLRHYRSTDYARLLRAQRTSQATINSFGDPVLVVDEQGRVEMANPAAQRLLGVTGKGADGPTAEPWLPPAALRQPLQEVVQSQRAYLPEGFDEILAFNLDGQDRCYLPRILPIADPFGNTLGAAVVLRDVTRFRLLDRVKSDLVATASHELKTPLTSLRLALHLLLEEAVGPLTPKQTELLVDARDNAERLLAIVNQLLDLARLEQGRERLELRPKPPRELLTSAAEAVQPRAQDKSIAVTVEAADDLPLVMADADRLGRALGNLLDNAVAYTERGGKIVLRAAGQPEAVTLEVADSGMVIPPEYLPRIFDRFFRIPGRVREGSTGLGLAIVREIVAAHGGEITCESTPGKGTTFRIWLPVRSTESRPPASTLMGVQA